VGNLLSGGVAPGYCIDPLRGSKIAAPKHSKRKKREKRPALDDNQIARRGR
jgi:hypothetical protein